MPLGGPPPVGDRRARVGVTAFTDEVVRHGATRSPYRLVGSRYVDAVERVGAIALLLPARDDIDDAMAAEIVATLDGLVLIGGGDLAGSWFGEEDHPQIGTVNPTRDVFEVTLARAALAAGLPVLGVCRGMQVLAVAAGGSVEQHLPDRLGHNEHGSGPGGLHIHRVLTVPGTRARDLLGEGFAAHCNHHQGVGRLGPFRASGWSEDGVLELMELPGEAFAVGIQSHPETVPDDRLFAALVAAG